MAMEIGLYSGNYSDTIISSDRNPPDSEYTENWMKIQLSCSFFFLDRMDDSAVVFEMNSATSSCKTMLQEWIDLVLAVEHLGEMNRFT